ncbi:MAG: hypothetical protein OMM_09229 [Candidatus Magnetoglobus multicellularis str. Araruama]|uniref:Uncharacterized protein n=1 Tax=Candidatus Magnetoglobus multicellularis str. Araruama TaxID=890399 RepID=A0A1V1P559_9BACT|nr:MAG: hypothetical protein OMM_09229 [Candidatus Magnetoglobus multicellularis str. Araruama]
MMNKKSIWNGLGNIYFTAIIFLMTIIDLLMGYYQIKLYPEIFHPLNDMGFIKWAQTYGKVHFSQSLWLFILIGLFALISINTFVCTTDRVLILFRHRKLFEKKFISF